jgi:hypothetical protein
MLTSELRTVATGSGPQGPELLLWLSVLALAVQEAQCVEPGLQQRARRWLRSWKARWVVELLRSAGVALPPHERLLRHWQAGWQREMPRAAA